MTTAEVAIIVAALGASFLTGLASLGLIWFQERLRGKSSDRDALAAAIVEMLSRSMVIATRAQALGELMKLRSGLPEGLDVVTRLRKPTDPLELHDWMSQDIAPMLTSWSVIWARGDQETVRLANALQSACGEMIDVCVATQTAQSARGHVRRWVVGQRWTPRMRADVNRAMKDLAHARKHLADYSRKILGSGAAELFGHAAPPDE